MPAIPKKVLDRLTGRLKYWQGVVRSALDRDVNEADTVTVIVDLLADLFGYDKYSEITKEHQIKSTFCDLAIILEGRLQYLIEVKAIGLDLKESHIQQVVNYGVNQGVEWVILTNARNWKVYRIQFSQPVTTELVVDFDLLGLGGRSQSDLDALSLLSREGIAKSVLAEYHAQKQATDRFSLAAFVMSEPILRALRREVRAQTPGVNVELEEIRAALESEVLKREVVEGEKADHARKRVARFLKKKESERTSKTSQSDEAQDQELAIPSSGSDTGASAE